MRKSYLYRRRETKLKYDATYCKILFIHHTNHSSKVILAQIDVIWYIRDECSMWKSFYELLSWMNLSEVCRGLKYSSVARVQTLVQSSIGPSVLHGIYRVRSECPNWIPQDSTGSNVILVLVPELIRTGLSRSDIVRYKLWYRVRFDLSFYMRVIAIISNDPIESHNTQQEAMWFWF